jgi:hypothetical protein
MHGNKQQHYNLSKKAKQGKAESPHRWHAGNALCKSRATPELM